MVTFIPGLRLSELFYREAVGPVLARAFPGMRYAAARLGSGSEVLGFDTERSMDHHWGPQLVIFLGEDDLPRYGEAMRETLRHELPRQFHGYPTSFGPADEIGVRLPQVTSSGPVEHMVSVDTVGRLVEDRLGISAYTKVGVIDWLVCSEQGLLEVTAGAVFHDEIGEVAAMRRTFASYPRDVWLYLLAAQWKRIAQQEAFVGRCGEVGDEIGSALVAAALVRDLMRLWFLMERRYAPYAKWLGSAFGRLDGAAGLLPSLAGTLAARSWPEREAHLAGAYETVAARHNRLEITEPLSTAVRPFYGRPFLVIDGERFSRAIRAQLTDPEVLRLPPDVGSVDQFVDATDVLAQGERRARLRAVYDKTG